MSPRSLLFVFAFTANYSHYRTPELQVVSFFEHYHPDNYRVYNLCAEPNRQYSVINAVSRSQDMPTPADSRYITN